MSSNEHIFVSPEPFSTKTSINNIKVNILHIEENNLVKDRLTTEKTESENAEETISYSSDDISKQCLNTSVQSQNFSSNLATPKKKNARKKEHLKQLKINVPSSNVMQSSQLDLVNYGQPNATSYQNYFSHQVNSLYACNYSRYLENLTHHPNYQYMCGNQQVNMFHNMQSETSAVTSLHQSIYNESANLLSSAAVHSEPNTPRYIQNAMHHPLLSHSLSFNAGASSSQLPLSTNQPTNKGEPNGKHKNKKSEKNALDYLFENYLPMDKVEEGLKNKTLIEGVLRINPKIYQHSYVSSNDRNEQDILIEGVKNRNRALEGDVVIVQLMNSEIEESDTENKQKKGKVVFIKEMIHNRTCIGTLTLMPDKNKQKALFTPRDHRIPRLNIPFISWPNNFYEDAKSYENTLFLAKLLNWSQTRFALGKIECNIGQSGDMMSETKAILAQTDLDVTPFGPDVQHLYPGLDFRISEEEINLREDCRHLCLFSIDPINTRDIDDAVSCRELDNGNYEIGVHISDVAHFLAENTILDDKVAEKATTIYLVEKAYHMLPDELCTLCSLSPGEDKLAFSVFWEITQDAKVLSHRFSKTVIHSCCQLAYEHAQAVLEDREAEVDFPKTCNGFNNTDVHKSIKMLGKITSILRRTRFENGALRIDQPKVSFHLSPSNGLPESFWIYESKESHQLIEEFMLLANITVAKKIYTEYPKIAFLRCHPSPSMFMLKQLSKELKPMGIDLDISSAGDLHRSLLPHVGPDNKDIGKAMVLNMLCAKPMARAKYFCADSFGDADFHHYALNVPLYTHFTSPIRRYADIMVHRLLAASINCKESPQWDVNKVRMIATQCNKQKYNAKKAGELSTELYILKYIEMNSPLETEAVVVDVRDKYIDIIIICMGLNRRIFFNNDFPGTFKCIKHEGGSKLSKMELMWHSVENLPEVKQVIDVFSILSVQLYKGDDMIKVETKLKRPKS